MPRAHRPGERGFALLIVLWSLVLLALIFTHLVSSGRGELQNAENIRNGARVEAAADGALYQAIFHLLDPSPARWAADGAAHAVRLPDGRATVTILDLSGRVNPNTASATLLAAVLREIGADRTTADEVAEAIVDWRTPDAQGPYAATRYSAAGLPYRPARSAFQSRDELGLVIGMTAPLLALLEPHLSLANPDNPDPAHADPVVRRALRDIGLDAAPRGGASHARDVVITALAVDSDGARFVRRATVRLSAADPYEILGWDNPPWP